MFLLGKLIRYLVPRVLIRDWSCKHPLPNLNQNSRLLKRKQLFSKNHIVCHNSLCTVSHSHQEWWEPSQCPSFLTPAKGQSCKQDFLRMAVPGWLWQLFLYTAQASCTVVFEDYMTEMSQATKSALSLSFTEKRWHILHRLAWRGFCPPLQPYLMALPSLLLNSQLHWPACIVSSAQVVFCVRSCALPLAEHHASFNSPPRSPSLRGFFYPPVEIRTHL